MEILQNFVAFSDHMSFTYSGFVVIGFISCLTLQSINQSIIRIRNKHINIYFLVWPNFYCTLSHILLGLPFKPKINNQLIKKFLSLAVSWVKVAKKWKIRTIKVNFLCQKLSKSFHFFSLVNINLGAHFFYWHFLKTSILKHFVY